MVNHKFEGTTPKNGRIEFKNVPLGTYQVRLEHDDYEKIVSQERLREDGRAPIYEMKSREEPKDVPKEEEAATFVVNAIEEGGEWLEDGIEGVDVKLEHVEK